VFRDRALFFHKNAFLQIRHKEMFRLLFDGKVQNLEFLSQALSMSLAGRVMGILQV
jgi:hypothetical protein